MAPVYPSDDADIQTNLLRAHRGASIARDLAGHLRAVLENLRDAIDATAGCDDLDDDALCDLRDELRGMGQRIEEAMRGVEGSADLRADAVALLTKLHGEVVASNLNPTSEAA